MYNNKHSVFVCDDEVYWTLYRIDYDAWCWSQTTWQQPDNGYYIMAYSPVYNPQLFLRSNCDYLTLVMLSDKIRIAFVTRSYLFCKQHRWTFEVKILFCWEIKMPLRAFSLLRMRTIAVPILLTNCISNV